MDDSHETREWQPHGLGHRDEAEGAGGSPSDHDTWLGGQWQGRVCRERESKLDYWWLLCNCKSLISNFCFKTLTGPSKIIIESTLIEQRRPFLTHENSARAVKRLKTIQIKDDICLIMGIVTELSPRRYHRRDPVWCDSRARGEAGARAQIASEVSNLRESRIARSIDWWTMAMLIRVDLFVIILTLPLIWKTEDHVIFMILTETLF